MANKKLTDGSVPAATTATGLQLYGVQDGATKRVDAGLLGGGGGGAGSVSSRTQLASSTATADSATFVAETGIEGTFKFTAGNQSAKVTADVDKALVVAPTAASTGASGAHIRVVDREYKAEWWLNGASASVGVPLRRMLAQVPAGASILMPAREISTELALYAHQANVTLKGTRGLSVLREAAGANIAATANNLFCFTNSNCTAEGMTFAPARHTLEAGGEFGLAFGSYYRSKGGNGSVAALAGPLVNPRVIDCDFIDGSEGLIFIADDNGGIIRMIENPVVQGCRFRNLDYQGLSLFGITGGDVSANEIEMAPHRVNGSGQAYGFACVMRVLAGSSGYRIHHNRVKGLGLNAVAGSDGRSSFIYFCGMALGPLRGKGLYGGQVDHNDVRDARIMWQFAEGPRGQLLLESNTLTNPDTNTLTTSFPALCEPTAPPAGFPWAFDELVLRNNRYRGVNDGFNGMVGHIERLEMDGERLKWGAKTPDGSAACVRTVTYSYSIPLKEAHVRGCRFDFPDAASECYFELDLADAASRGSVVGNEGPPGTPLYGYVAASGSGLIRTQVGGNYAAVASLVTPGDNSKLAAVAGGGGGGGSTPAQRAPNTTFDNATGVTLGAGASISGGQLHLGTTQFATTSQALTGPFLEGEQYQIVVDVFALGDTGPVVQIGPSWGPGAVNNRQLVAGVNTYTVTISATHAGNDMRLDFYPGFGSATLEALINGVTVTKV